MGAVPGSPTGANRYGQEEGQEEDYKSHILKEGHALFANS